MNTGSAEAALTAGIPARDVIFVVLPNVVLLDLAMPGVDGWELAGRLRAEPCLDGVVLLAVSGYGGDADRQRSYAAGIDEHLVKPVEPERLFRLLEQYAARHSQRLASAGR